MSAGLVGRDEAPVLRASHEDRDRVVDVLRRAAGDGRLTVEELDERVEAALTARMMGELTALTRDLPVDVDDILVAEPKDVVRIEQRGGSVRRGEGWVVPRRLEIVSAWGDVTLDLSQAVITRDTLHIDLDMCGGTLKLVTPPGVAVDTDSLVSNYAKIKTRANGDADGPVVLRVVITGEIGLGRILIRRARRSLVMRAPKP
ncbi:DUF1707 domain-containing protein [Streptomyces sp. NPDC006385]|uniref:DUF1707 SHOCT-like domain-containing protein n=1 Tax=Streptomyces sp. NPDC006385 TaxID=3156761 RepID=UPI0033B82F34